MKLFYNLVFVYMTSQATESLRHVQNDIVNLPILAIFAISHHIVLLKKGAVVDLVHSMNLDYGKYEVNNVCPGAAGTAIFKQNLDAVQDNLN